ncbi:MAG: hypothetical protein Unbinned3891contig1000_95 [Prokaryotic dsDNA virus sp.]|nr:MAG: hypothetical protein Unbinned3891contig1000_95 [Prokaryotic dsDNA virus sp.]
MSESELRVLRELKTAVEKKWGWVLKILATMIVGAFGLGGFTMSLARTDIEHTNAIEEATAAVDKNTNSINAQKDVMRDMLEEQTRLLTTQIATDMDKINDRVTLNVKTINDLAMWQATREKVGFDLKDGNQLRLDVLREISELKAMQASQNATLLELVKKMDQEP